jgi:uncharacterized protein (DUF2336 family)
MAQSSIILELERAIESHDAQRRTAALSSVADLFKSARIQDVNDERLELFDDLFAQLVKDMTTSTLAKLSTDLSLAKVAPVKLVQQLAQNDAIEVAHSILTRSSQVSDETLIQIAKTKGQEHLEALAGRAQVNEAVSDLLIARGNDRVIQTVTANANAKISERGFGSLTERFSGHEKIAVNIAMRQDVPPRVMKALLTRATDTVRSLILSSAPAETRQALSDLLKECLNPEEIQSSVTRVTAEARRAVIELKAKGRLKEDALVEFAKKRMFGETVAALASLSAVPAELVESQMYTEGRETILIICKSISLKWTTVVAILCLRDHPPTPAQLEVALNDYTALSVENALRAMRFFYAKQSILKR